MQTIKPYIDALHLAGADPIIWAAFGNMWCAKIMHKGETRWVIAEFDEGITEGDPGARPQAHSYVNEPDAPIEPMLAWLRDRFDYERHLMQFGRRYLRGEDQAATCEEMAGFIRQQS